MPIPSTMQGADSPPSLLPGAGGATVSALPRPEFCLVHNPFDLWDVATEGLDAPRFLPRFYPFAFTPGVQGCRQYRNEGEREADPASLYRAPLIKLRGSGHVVLYATDARTAAAEMERWGVVDASHLPAGEAPGSYLRADRVAWRGLTGWRWRTVWEKAMPALPGTLQRFKHDAAPFNRWRAHLLDAGHIAPPPELVIEEIRRPLERRLGEARTAQIEDSIKRLKIERAEAALSAFEAAAAPTPAPTPPARSKRRQGAS